MGLAIALGLGIAPGIAVAQSDVEAREKQALAACDSAQVQKGIELLGGLWADTQDSTYLYNQGRCYQKNSMGKEALARFREFLRVVKDHPPDNAGLVERAQGFVAELERSEEPPRRAPAVPAAAISAPIPVAPPARATADSPAAGALGVEAASSRRLRKMAGLTSGGFGLVAGITGAVLVIDGASRANAARDRLGGAKSGADWDRAKPDYDAGVSRYRTGWVVSGIGAAALVAGVVLIGTARQPERPVQVDLGPWLAAHSGGAVIRGTW